jgi:hypothetical protein
MIFHHCQREYEMPDDWWQDAGMNRFTPTRTAFRADPAAYPWATVFEVPVEQVSPLERKLSHGVFNDRQVPGSARARVVRILTAFREGRPLPPVEVLPLRDRGRRFALYDGAHRFYCAIVAGFTAVPAVDVSNRPATDVDLDEDRGAG